MADSALVGTAHNGMHVPEGFSPIVNVYVNATFVSGVPTTVTNGSSPGATVTGDTGVYTFVMASKAARLLMFSWASIQAEAAGVEFQIESVDLVTGTIIVEGSAATPGTAADVPDGEYLFKFELAMRSPGT